MKTAIMKKNIFDAWLEYQKVAIHFNELLIKLRIQALGGVVAISTLAGFIAKYGNQASFNWGLLTCIFVVLIFAWTAIWILDFLYYNRLLLGAVDEIMRLEKVSEKSTELDKIALSTQIEKVERTGHLDNFPNRTFCERIKQGWVLFYLITFLGLAAALTISLIEWVHTLPRS